MSLSVFYYCICPCLCRCRSFNPSLCRLSPFRLSYVAVSRPCRLSKFTLTGPQNCGLGYVVRGYQRTRGSAVRRY